MSARNACGMRILAELILMRLDEKVCSDLQDNGYWDAFWQSFETEIEAGGTCVRIDVSKEDECLNGLRRLSDTMTPESIASLLHVDAQAFTDKVRTLLKMPFVLEHTADAGVAFFYPQRQFLYELRLARALRALCEGDEDFSIDSAPFEDAMEGSFALSDEQRSAITMILRRRLTVVSGKPGSGKTTVVVRALSALFTANPDLTVMQMAPTGKASARIAEALADAIDNRNLQGEGAEALRRAVKEGRVETKTLHKWLYELESQPREACRQRFLDADVIVVDEGSMLSIDLAVRLFESIDSSRTRVILLGDKNQLAAVGPGRVFADLCDTEEGSLLAGHVAIFQMSHRFPAASRVGRMADLLLDSPSGERDAKLLTILSDLRLQNVPFAESVVVGSRFKSALSESIRSWLELRFRPIRDAVSAFQSAVSRDSEALRTRAVGLCALLRDVRVLCAARAGRNGLEAVNAYMEEWMRLGLHHVSKTDPCYSGRLVIVRENRPDLRLSNGDVGIILEIESGLGPRRIFVPETFGLSADDRLSACIDARELPRCDAAYALTVHQSQGSEYAYVLLVMPETPESGLATRELLYTGATRVKFASEQLSEEPVHLKIVTSPAVWQKVTTQFTERSGRLSKRLLGR